MIPVFSPTLFMPIAGGPFTPANLADLTTWYDASDTGTVTESGGFVQAITDKSANANHLARQSTDNIVLTPNAINGLSVLTFSTLGYLKNSSAAGLSGLITGISYAMIGSATSPGANGCFWEFSSSGGQNDTLHHLLFGGNHLLRNVGTAVTSNSDASTAFHIHAGSAIVTGGVATTGNSFFDGTAYAVTQGGTTGNTAALTPTFITMGALMGGGFSLTGTVGELVFFSGASTTDRQKLEGYLAWKWGLEANLPGGHPYVGAPP